MLLIMIITYLKGTNLVFLEPLVSGLPQHWDQVFSDRDQGHIFHLLVQLCSDSLLLDFRLKSIQPR